MNLRLIVILIIYFFSFANYALDIASENRAIKNTSRYYYSMSEAPKKVSSTLCEKRIVSNLTSKPQSFTQLLNTNYSQALVVYKKQPNIKLQDKKIIMTKKNRRLVRKLRRDIKKPTLIIKKPTPKSITYNNEIVLTSTNPAKLDKENKQDISISNDDDENNTDDVLLTNNDESNELEYYNKIMFANSSEIYVFQKVWLLVDLLFTKKTNFAEQYKDWSLSSIALGIQYTLFTFKELSSFFSCNIKSNFEQETNHISNEVIFGKINLDFNKKKGKTEHFALSIGLPLKQSGTLSKGPDYLFEVDYAFIRNNVEYGLTFKNGYSACYLIYPDQKKKIKFYTHVSLGKTICQSENNAICKIELGLYYQNLYAAKNIEKEDWGMTFAFEFNI